MPSFSTTQSLRILPAALIALGIATSAAAKERIYVPMGSDDKIVIVDPKTNMVTGLISDVPAVHGLAATPDGRYLVAGSYDERAPGDAPAKPKGMSAAAHAKHHPKKGGAKMAAAAKTETMISTLSVFSLPGHTVVRRIDVPGAVHHVAVGPASRFVIATQPGQNAVSIVDLKDYSVLKTIPTGELPNYAVFSATGGRAYVSNAGNGTVSEIDTNLWTVSRNYQVGNSPEHIALSSDGGMLYANNVDDGTVSVVDTTSGKTVKTIQIGGRLHGIDLSGDGKTLFVAAMEQNKVVAVDLRTYTYRSVVTNPAPYHLTAIKGGKLYVASAEDPKAWIIDQKSLAITGEIQIGGKGHQMVQVSERE